jgi:triphosphoribosyl-dephospho-CoA synthase
LAAGRPRDEAYEDALADLDFWLRCDGHLRNPGTTADLVTAGLFAALREGIIEAPFRLARSS